MNQDLLKSVAPLDLALNKATMAIMKSAELKADKNVNVNNYLSVWKFLQKAAGDMEKPVAEVLSTKTGFDLAGKKAIPLKGLSLQTMDGKEARTPTIVLDLQ